MEIPAKFLHENEIEFWQIKEKFKSKRNDVYLIDAITVSGDNYKWVIKIYNNEKNQNQEVEFLKLLKGNNIKVPAVYYNGSNYIIMEYVSCLTVLDYLNKCEKNNIEIDELESFLKVFSSWLVSFYQAIKRYGNYILGDVNYRNFIFVDEKNIYGVDFENCYLGRKEEDIGKLSAFGLSYHPTFTDWKFRFINKLIQVISTELSLNIDNVKYECLKELDDIKIRRNISIPKNDNIIENLFSKSP